ncbi:MAG: PilZ domain-containing protein [Acidobacteria bacterium]|nr:PilZ domain-containing protein [Acidobacteriota bacterium]
MSSTVLIASSEHLPALKERDDFEGAMAFADTEALRALDAITRQRPGVVALERLFAATSRGAALINRIKADPSLSGCEIRIVAHDSEYARVSPRRPGEAAAAAPAAVAEAPRPAAAAPLDQRGTRRAPRFKMVDGVDLQIDGNSATIVDLSLVGAQVLSATILKPNQRVRISLADGPRPARFSGAVAWASFEIPKGAPRYRAGVEFFDADQAVITRLIESKKR